MNLKAIIEMTKNIISNELQDQQILIYDQFILKKILQRVKTEKVKLLMSLNYDREDGQE